MSRSIGSRALSNLTQDVKEQGATRPARLGMLPALARNNMQSSYLTVHTQQQQCTGTTGDTDPGSAHPSLKDATSLLLPNHPQHSSTP